MERNNNNFPENSIINTFRSPEALSIIHEILDIGLDHYITDPILQKIPFVKWVFALKKSAVSVRDYFLIKKIIEFLSDLDEITKEDKSSFLKIIEL